MTYEKTPIRKRALIKRAFAAKQTNDMSKLSTQRILLYLAKRHQTDLLILAVTAQFILLVVSNT